MLRELSIHMQNDKFQRKPLLVLTGQYQNGKSTFLNCLLGGNYAVEGQGLVTTKYNTKYTWGNFHSITAAYPNGKLELLLGNKLLDTLSDLEKSVRLEITTYSPLLQNMDLLDSPGCGANTQDDKVAEIALDMADFVIFILQKLPSTPDISFMKELQNKGKHFTVILNCMDERDPFSNSALNLGTEIIAKLKNEKLNSNYVAISDKYPVYPVNLLWAQCAIAYLDSAEHKKRYRRTEVFLDNDNLLPSQLWEASNFAPLRTLVTSFVTTFFNYTPATPLQLFTNVSESLTTALQNTLKGKF